MRDAVRQDEAPKTLSTGESVRTRSSRSEQDDRWDDFLSSMPEGQFQQTSAWARVKAVAGWNVDRTVFECKGRVVGGFQMLTKCLVGGFRIGYVSKGPVLSQPELGEFALKKLREAVRSGGLWAVIIQAPDRSPLARRGLRPLNVQPNRIIGVIESTVVLDLSHPLDELRHGLSRSTRYKINRASREGIKIVTGDRSNLSEFFDLMLNTCKRQAVKPNPSSIDELEVMWDSFAPRNQLELTFAVSDEKKVAGQLTFQFGDTVTIWKVGWSEEVPWKHPNHKLRWDSITRAAAGGFRRCDFGGLEADIAEDLLHGKKPTRLEKSRDLFSLGFGGSPIQLAPSFVYIPNRVGRIVYRLSTRCSQLLARSARSLL